MAWHKSGSGPRGYGHAWRKVRAYVMARDMHLCQPCLAKDKVTPATECDHVIPKHKGGTDAPDNLVSICTPCHKAKSAEEMGRTYKPKPRIGPDGWPVEA